MIGCKVVKYRIKNSSGLQDFTNYIKKLPTGLIAYPYIRLNVSLNKYQLVKIVQRHTEIFIFDFSFTYA